MKILVNTTPPTNKGGVANHYKGLKKYWTEEVHYNYIGGRHGIPGSVIILFDLVHFMYKCFFLKPDVVVLNPSLGKTALIRDAFFLRISKFFGNVTILFFHGWDEKHADRIDNQPEKFIRKFNRADGFLVLASAFEKKLKEWGITKPIYVTSTKVDNALIDDFDITAKELNATILFLARIEPEKGIFETLEAYKEIKQQHPSARLMIAGSGSALSEALDFVERKNLLDVEFKGYVTGRDLRLVYQQSDIYLFPTTHGEGMPTSVLEAMAFGLPVITRPVGGIPDFFEDGKMGFITPSLESSDFAEKIILLLNNREKVKEISRFNYKYARNHFLASEVVTTLEKIFQDVYAEIIKDE